MDPVDYDAAIVGVAYDLWVGDERGDAVVYDLDRVIDITRESCGGSYDDAKEYFHHNIAGAFAGPSTPIFLRRIESIWDDAS